MAKKTKPAPSTPEQEYVDERIKDFLGDDPTTSETETPTETPADTGAEDTTATKQEDRTPSVDPDLIKQEVTTAVKEQIIQSLTGKREDQLEQSPWEKEGRNPRDYREIADWATEQATKKLNSDQQAAAEAAAKQQEASTKQWNEYWDKQLDGLTKEGRLPPVTDANNPEDAGVAARKELWTSAYEHKETNLELAYYKYVATKPRQPAGASAPVSLGRKSVERESTDSFSYDEIHGKDFDEILTGR